MMTMKQNNACVSRLLVSVRSKTCDSSKSTCDFNTSVFLSILQLLVTSVFFASDHEVNIRTSILSSKFEKTLFIPYVSVCNDEQEHSDRNIENTRAEHYSL
jgi:hypothetical protein